jgi:RNA polymerase sigma-B factor
MHPTTKVNESTPEVDKAGRSREDRVLLERYQRTGDLRLRDEILERFMPLVHSLARRYHRSSEPFEDLAQVAAVGLIKAIDRYDPSRGFAFSSYAVPTITGELKRYFRDYSWAVRPPRDLQELTLRVDRVAAELTRDLERSPTTAELSQAAGITEEELLESIQAKSARGAISLQAPVGHDGDATTIEDCIGYDDGGIARAETSAVVDGLLTHLSPRERVILHLRFSEDMTQAEIGEVVGVSQMQISRIIRQALQRLRAAHEALQAAVAA